MSNITIQGKKAADGKTVEHIHTVDNALEVASVGIGGNYLAQTTTVGATRERIELTNASKAITIHVRHTAAADVTLDDGVLLCIGAPDTGTADGWLNEANEASRYCVMAGDSTKTFYLNGDTSNIVDLIGVGTSTAVTVTVGGIY